MINVIRAETPKLILVTTGSGQTRVRWKLLPERLGVGPRWP